MLCGSGSTSLHCLLLLPNTKVTLWYLFQRRAHESAKQALSSIICINQAPHPHHHRHIIPPISSPRVSFQSQAVPTPLQCPPKELINKTQCSDWGINSSSRKIIRAESGPTSRKTLSDNHLRGSSCGKTFFLPRTVP